MNRYHKRSLFVHGFNVSLFPGKRQIEIDIFQKSRTTNEALKQKLANKYYFDFIADSLYPIKFVVKVKSICIGQLKT